MKQWVVQFVEDIREGEKASGPHFLDLYAANYTAESRRPTFTTTDVGQASRFPTKDIAGVELRSFEMARGFQGLMFKLVEYKAPKEPLYKDITFEDIRNELMEYAKAHFR